MILRKEQRKEFEELVRPLIEFLNCNCHPHVSVTITTNRVELSEGICMIQIPDYIKD